MKKYIALSFMCMAIAGGTNIIGMETQKACELCFEERNSNEFKPLSCCAYDASCADCLLGMINTSLQEKTIAHIVCPSRTCMKPVVAQDIYAITDTHPEVYEMFCEIASYEYMTKQVKQIKHCPTPDCSYSFENDHELKQEFKCPQCNHIYCSDCLVQHAQEMTCEQAHEHLKIIGDKSKEEIANEEWLQKNTKACPHCKASVEKNGGCNHMTCKKCTHEFCWTCGATYRTTRCNTNYCATTNTQLPIGQLEQGQPAVNNEVENIQGHWVFNAENALMRAIEHNNLAAIRRRLIAHGADVNVQNRIIALQIAIQHNNPALVQMLLAHPNININLANNRGVQQLIDELENNDDHG